MEERGAKKSEVVQAIQEGEWVPARERRLAFRYNFEYNSTWAGKRYRIKQVVPIVVKEEGSYIVVTVYTFYF